MSKGLEALECIKHKLSALEFVLGHDRIPKRAPYIQETIFHVIENELKALEIIKECLVSEFKLFEKNGEYYILFYFDEIHELTFKLKNKEEFDLLKEVLNQ